MTKPNRAVPPPIPSDARKDELPSFVQRISGEWLARGISIGVDLGDAVPVVSIVHHGVPVIVPADQRVSLVGLPAVTGDTNDTPEVRGIVLNSERPPPSSVFPPSLGGDVIAIPKLPALGGDLARSIGLRTDKAFEAEGKLGSLKQTTAMALATARKQAEAYSGRPVSGAVLSVPASFGERQRETVRRAAQEAKVHVLRIVTRPTAAALSLDLDVIGERVVVADAGVGALEISVVNMKDGKPKVVATGRVEQVHEATVADRSVAARVAACIDEVFWAAGIDKARVDALLFVADEKLSAAARDQLQSSAGRRGVAVALREDAIAMGAARLAEELGGSLSDVLPASIGFAGRGDGFLRLVAKDTKLPAKRTFVVNAGADGGARYTLPLYQGESQEVRGNEYIGDLVIDGAPAELGVARAYELTFTIDAQCIMSASAVNAKSGASIPTRIEWVGATGTRESAPEDTRRMKRPATRDEGTLSALASRFRRMFA